MAAFPTTGSARAHIPMDVVMMPNPAYLMASMNALAVDIRSFREPLTRAIRRVLQPSFDQNFEVGGRPPWAPLAESTKEYKAREGYPEATLIRTKNLRRTAGFLSIWTVTREEAFIDHMPHYAFYGVYHQAGSPQTNLPQRQFLLVQDEDAEKIEDVFVDWIGERLRHHGWTPGFSEALSGI